METETFIKKYKYYLAILLLLFMLASGLYMYIERDKIFMYEVEMKYSDGCIETSRNGILVSPICENGRHLEELYNNNIEKKYNPLWQMNLTIQK